MDDEILQNAMFTREALISLVKDDDRKDIDKECGYPDTIAPEDYRKMYDREGVARRIVNVLPEETWVHDPDIVEDEEDDETEFEGAFKELIDKHNIWHFLQRLDELSGIGRFGILLIGFDDGLGLDEPVEGINEQGEPVGNTERELLYLRVFDESVVEIQATELDVTNPRYGLPTYYNIILQQPNGSEQRQRVHWSRVIHVADNKKTSEVFGTPRMQPVYNRLHDIRKILSGSGEMFWQGAFPGYSFELDPKLNEANVEIDTDKLREEARKYSQGLQRYLALAGVTVKSLSPQVSDPTGHIEANLRGIAISIGIPHRILFGSEQAQLASQQDALNWAKRIHRRQEKHVTPMIIRPFIDRLIAVGVLPEPEQYTATWQDLISYSEEDRTRVADMKTATIGSYIERGVDQLIPPETFLRMIMGFDNEEVEAIMKEAEKYMQQTDGFGDREPETDGNDDGNDDDDQQPTDNYNPYHKYQPRDEKGRFAEVAGGEGALREFAQRRERERITEEEEREAKIQKVNELKSRLGNALGGDVTLRPTVDHFEEVYPEDMEDFQINLLEQATVEAERVANDFPYMFGGELGKCDIVIATEGSIEHEVVGSAAGVYRPDDHDKDTMDPHHFSEAQIDLGLHPSTAMTPLGRKDIGHTMRHEMAHHIEYASGGVYEPFWFDELEQFHAEGGVMSEEVSHYAGTNSREAFAEMFAFYNHPDYVDGFGNTAIDEPDRKLPDIFEDMLSTLPADLAEHTEVEVDEPAANYNPYHEHQPRDEKGRFA